MWSAVIHIYIQVCVRGGPSCYKFSDVCTCIVLVFVSRGPARFKDATRDDDGDDDGSGIGGSSGAGVQLLTGTACVADLRFLVVG